MTTYPYWRKQSPGQPVFPDMEWEKPERRDQLGKLSIIGGNKLSFVAVAEAYSVAISTGAGSIRTLLPDALRKTIPASMVDVVFAPSNPSGGLAKEAHQEMATAGRWADATLLIGDSGRNSETAIVYEDFIRDYSGPLTITRDALDLVRSNPDIIINRPQTLLVTSFAQLQKLFQSVYYPKILTFNMQLTQLVEALHKFTITYPCTVVTLHSDHIILAHNGEVVTQTWDNPMAIWKGSVATKMATHWLWSPTKPLESISQSIV